MGNKTHPIPFFVVDRPMSLKILEYCEINKQSGVFGLMGHANTSKRFQELFESFPTDNIVKMADSGVFSKDGCKLDYEHLFSIYEGMGAEYGIMIDFLKDKEKTIESAESAIKIYGNGKYSFKLVGVAQGNTIGEYAECYDNLKLLGFDHIAIGGLLKKYINTTRYVRVKDENFLKGVLAEIRSNYINDWLFMLGCYNPRRHALFKEFGVFGGDYKGWIFNYKTPDRWIEDLNKDLELSERKIIENRILEELLAERVKITQELEESRGSKDLAGKIENKKIELDMKILSLRKNIVKQTNNAEYSLKVQTLEKFLNMDKDTKRDYRFKQIKAYLDKNIFSLFRDYLLIISCSQRKVDIPNPAPAIELYDGSIFRIIKKMYRERRLPKNMHVLIISAKYGLLGSHDLIEKYDQKMTEDRAKELKHDIEKKLDKFLSDNEFKEIFVSMGKNYCLSIEDFDFKVPIEYASGRIGEKLSKTKRWIESKNE